MRVSNFDGAKKKSGPRFGIAVTIKQHPTDREKNKNSIHPSIHHSCKRRGAAPVPFTNVHTT